MFKQQSKKFVSLALFIVISISTVAGPSAEKGSAASNVSGYTKNETVYVNLQENGSIADINVVNAFTGVNGQIIDYGDYEEITNLTSSAEPEVNGERILFTTAGHTQFYYQGRLRDKELPWIFNLTYEHDGKPLDPSLLSGVNGFLKISIDIALNNEASKLYHENYMLQVSVPLDMERVQAINAPDATKVVVGKQAILTFTLLPGEAGTFVIEADVEAFAMGGMEITAVNSTLPLGEVNNEISSGFHRLSDGVKEMIDGTGKLKTGLTDLNGGINRLHRGVVELGEGKNSVLDGMNDFKKGLSGFTTGLPDLQSGSNRIQDGLWEAFQGSEQLVDVYGGMEEGLASMLENKEQLEQLAAGLLQSPDIYTQLLAEAMLKHLGGIEQLHGGMMQANSGLAVYSTGMETMAEEYAELNKGVGHLTVAGSLLTGGYDELYEGANLVLGGIDELKTGTAQLKRETGIIPTEVQKLIDGQKEMNSGIDEAKNTLEQFTAITEKKEPLSFVAPGRVSPDTVQFIIRTPEIEAAVAQKTGEDYEESRKNFWQRFVSLFRS